MQAIRNFDLGWQLISAMNRKMSDDDKIWYVTCLLGYADDQMAVQEEHHAAPFQIWYLLEQGGGLKSPYCQSIKTLVTVPFYKYIKENHSDYKSKKKGV